MNNIFSFPLASNITICLSGKEMRKTPSRYTREIESIWEAEKKEGFFNGTVLSIVRYSSSKIDCELVSYKAFYATVRNSALRKVLGIFPLGMSGRTFFKDKILIGTRGKHVALYPGEKECVPSGSIDRLFLRKDGTIDLSCGITTELSEESGISPKYVEKIEPRSLYWDAEAGVFDIHLDIFLKNETSIENLSSPLEEYDAFCWVEKENLTTAFLEECLPLSRVLLQKEYHGT